MRPPGHLLPPTSALGLIPQKLPRVTPVRDCTPQGEQPQVKDRSIGNMPALAPRGWRDRVRSWFGVIGPIGCPERGLALWHSPSSFVPCGEGAGLHHTQTKCHREAQPSLPTGTSSVSVLPPHVFLPPATGRVRTRTSPALLHPQQRPGLNFWPQSLHSAGKQAGTRWDSHGGGVWQRPGPGTGLTWPSMQDKHLPTCALPQMNERQESEYRPIFLLTSVFPAGHPHTAGPPPCSQLGW